MQFSVVMSVYRNDNPTYVKIALDSITSLQIRKPDEVVLVVDGPVSDDLRLLIENRAEFDPDLYNVIWLPENKGLGNALRMGVDAARNEIIARMDSDDISVADRFENQIAYMEAHPECDIVGGQITEFIDQESNIVGKRTVPCESAEIYDYMKKRCPYNHMTVMMKKTAVLDAGNYLDWHYNEDYYLWIRMALKHAMFANLPDTLVNVRVGKDMYARRGGWKYFISEKKLQDYLLNNKMISGGGYLENILKRFIVQVCLPNSLRAKVFRVFARD